MGGVYAFWQYECDGCCGAKFRFVQQDEPGDLVVSLDCEGNRVAQSLPHIGVTCEASRCDSTDYRSKLAAKNSDVGKRGGRVCTAEGQVVGIASEALRGSSAQAAQRQ